MATLLAATATDSGPIPGWLVLAGIGLIWAGGYVVACAIWPFAKCPQCKGTGKHHSPTGKAWRKCRRCKGTGARLRTGRHIWNWLRKIEKGSA